MVQSIGGLVTYNITTLQNQDIRILAHESSASLAEEPLSGSKWASDFNPTLTTPRIVHKEDVVERIEELCGLAGIRPSTRATQEWNGSSEFGDGNTIASCRLFKSQISSTPFIEVVPVDFQLVANLKQAALNVETAEDENMVFIASKEILQLVLPQIAQLATFDDIGKCFAFSALAVQFLCLGLLSYAQAHVGPLQPFFLDTPLRKINLLGLAEETVSPCLVAELVNLTCLGNMTRGPVLAFYASPGRPNDSLLGYPAVDLVSRYDVLGRAENILDTWGPGSLVFREDTAGPPVAIKIGDGFIFTHSTSGKFHWAQEVKEPAQLRGIDLSHSLVIGTLVVPNARCQISEADCRMASAGALGYLGASRSSWKRSQRQVALQGGQYISGQLTDTWSKQKGIPVKEVALSSLQHGLIGYLDEYWGLQTYCHNFSLTLLSNATLNID
ncbi:hypothetical protein N7522_002416 [Penicillium canescens]|nr:hypothetical protein N7522_002416 [Penicillium canescens]